MVQPSCFFFGILENPLALFRQGEICGRWNLFTSCDARFNPRPHFILNIGSLKQLLKQIGFFAQQSQQKVLRLDSRAAEHARFVPGKEDDATCALRITLKHVGLRE